MNNDLQDKEQEWLSIFRLIPYENQREIMEQIRMAKWTREYTDYYYFLHFDVPKSCPPISIFDSSFELEALVSHAGKTDDTKQTIYGAFDPIPVDYSNTERAPTHFLLHIHNGYVKLLEIYNLDSSKIDPIGLAEGEIKYRIPEQLRVNSIC